MHLHVWQCNALQVNVEYNLLDPLLRSTINPQGDVNDDTGVWVWVFGEGG
jgi:hypothetical protein